MKKILNILNSAIIIPIIPCIICVTIKWLYFGYFRMDFFNAAEIAFTLSMYHLLCLIGTNKLTDQDLAKLLMGPYVFVVILFLGLFSGCIIFDALFQNDLLIYFSKYPAREEFKSSIEGVISRYRWFILVTGIVSLIISEFARKKYNITVEII